MISNLKDLMVYKKAFTLAMDIFEISKNFSKEEKFSLTDQIRRSSRSVCASLGESYRRRQYESHFINKISEADMENAETQVWLDFALACSYISREQFDLLLSQSEEIGKLLHHMIKYPEKYRGNLQLKK
ncbi:MAG TPA: four helix bundle protein [Bacteroidales bacterium]|nr:four helix bundle protein [Bacteroidales bacterium]HNS46655.1 four helix bundle protein [Bacteroidales bacterium]